MRITVDFEDERQEFEVSAESLVGSWQGPEGCNPAETAAAIARALEEPLDFPPARQMIVPGDRVAIALDSGVTEAKSLLNVLGEMLGQSGVAAEDVTVVATPPGLAELAGELPHGMTLEIHDPQDRSGIAYLAATAEGRRIYLNRHLTDADVVIPVGRLGYDPILGYRGPWSVIFPGLSDQETREAYRRTWREEPQDRVFPHRHLDEPFEVSWLLGTQYHLGLLSGAAGLAEAVGGLAQSVRDKGTEAVDRRWNFQPESRADLVVIGLGNPGRKSGLDDLVEGLVTGSRLVRQGGKIVALSRAEGAIGPGLKRLADAGDPRLGKAALRGHEAEADSVTARRLAEVLLRADVYLLSSLDRQAVEDLSMICLDRPQDASRLVERASSCLFVSHADLTRGTVREKDEA